MSDTESTVSSTDARALRRAIRGLQALDRLLGDAGPRQAGPRNVARIGRCRARHVDARIARQRLDVTQSAGPPS